MNRILIVEDEPRIASFLEKGLRANGFTTMVAGDGREALSLAHSGGFDLLILDIGLPGMDGFDVLRELRTTDRATPVIILTARHGVGDTVAGLDGGADDYVTKPFRFEELLARVRVRLRGDRAPEESVLTVGDASLDLRTRRARVGDRTIELTAREFALAETLFRHPGQVLSREQLLSHVWGYDYDPGSNVVDVYVGYLRKKLGDNWIATVRGMGYRLEDQGSRPSELTRILFIEDEGRTAQTAWRELGGDGWEVVMAEDGDVGLFLATTESFDVVVLALHLPAASGLDVLRKIKSEQADLPVIVLADRDDPKARGASLKAGASDFLTQPLAVEAVRDAVLQARGSAPVEGPA